MASIRRVIFVLAVLLRHVCAHYGGTLIRKIHWIDVRLPTAKLSKPDRLKTVFETLGGSFVKLGQMLALQPDILPMEYCHALYSLLDRVPPVPFEEIDQVLLDEVGKRAGEIFDTFDEKSIASGSIGQVHVATLDGRKVAVKVQRPDTKAGFERDIKIMNLMVWVITKLHIKPLDWMIDPLTEFATWTLEELDFRREARYMKQLRRNAAENKHERIPAIINRLSTRRVLSVEFLEGVTLLDHMRLTEQNNPQHIQRLLDDGFDADRFATNIIDNFLGDAFQYGIFHADLHPANLMVLKDNVVGYIDFGITGVISAFSRQNLVAITLAYARKDLTTLCEKFFDVSSLDDRSDPEAFRAGIQALSEKWYQGGEDDPSLKTTTTIVMLDMLKLSRHARIWPQRDVIKYIRSAIAIDGLIRQFAPEFDVGFHLAASCRRYLSWHARKTMFSHDTMINWATASTDLMQNGAFRFSTILQNIGRSKSNAEQSPARRPRERDGMKLSVQIAFLFSLVFLISSVTGTPGEIGFNLFTAQLLMIVGVGGLLVRTLLTSFTRKPIA